MHYAQEASETGLSEKGANMPLSPGKEFIQVSELIRVDTTKMVVGYSFNP